MKKVLWFSFLLLISIFAGVLSVISTDKAKKFNDTQLNKTIKENLISSHRQFYVAGVVEYKPIPIGNQTPVETIHKNIEQYVILMEEAARQHVHIIVFPEYGLTADILDTNRKTIRDFLVEIPKFGIVPCQLNNTSNLQKLSCAAKNLKIYTVVNLGEIEKCDPPTDPKCPTDEAYFYNTNVVFDRNGAIIAKYRKFHLYLESHFNQPDMEYSTFLTDFGIEFGIFTCFDIAFAHPGVKLIESKGIRNFVFPTAWVDELPFLTSIQAHSLWAQSNQANLLASGYHDPTKGSMGSGIYSGFNQDILNYTYDPSSGTKLLISSVPIHPKSVPFGGQCSHYPKTLYSFDQSERHVAHHEWLREDLSNYTHKDIDPMENEDSLCHLDKLCCRIEYDLINSTKSFVGHLKLFAFEGRRTVAAKTDYFDWQVCAILHCINDTLESCTEQDYPISQLKYHPKFQRLSIQMQPIKLEYKKSISQPGLSLLDTQFNLIPQYYFDIKMWTDVINKNNVTFAEASSKTEHKFEDINIKTVSIIQKIYNGRI